MKSELASWRSRTCWAPGATTRRQVLAGQPRRPTRVCRAVPCSRESGGAGDIWLPEVTDQHRWHSKPGPGPLPNPTCKKQQPSSGRPNQAPKSSDHPASCREKYPLRTWPVSITACCPESFKSVSRSDPKSAVLVCALTSLPSLQCTLGSSVILGHSAAPGSAHSSGSSGTPRSGSSHSRLLPHQAHPEEFLTLQQTR